MIVFFLIPENINYYSSRKAKHECAQIILLFFSAEKKRFHFFRDALLNELIFNNIRECISS